MCRAGCRGGAGRPRREHAAAAGTTEAAKLRDALAATRDYEGVTGKTTIDADRNASKAAAIITIKDGKFRFVETVEP